MKTAAMTPADARGNSLKTKGVRLPLFDRETVLELIITELEQGVPLSVICRREGMPSRRLVDNWTRDFEDVRARIARARGLGEEAMLEEIIKIADDQAEDAKSRKVRIWARLEALKRFNPSRWGDQPGAGPTVNVGVNVQNVMSDEKLADLARLKRESIERRRAAAALNPATPARLPDSVTNAAETGEIAP